MSKKKKAESILSARQLKVVQLVASGSEMTKQQIIEAAGYSPRTASTNVFESTNVREALKGLNITPSTVLKTLKDAQKANVVVTYRGEAHESDVPDHRMRTKASVDIAEIAGMKKIQIQQESINVNLDIADARELFG